MYPWIPWEMVADPLGFAEHSLGTTGVEGKVVSPFKQAPCSQGVWSRVNGFLLY